MAEQGTPEIVRNPDTDRFEVADAPDSGYLTYREADGRLTLEHTSVDELLEGTGVGSALVREALAYGEAEGLTIVPQCDFVAGWLDRHPDRAAELDVEAA